MFAERIAVQSIMVFMIVDCLIDVATSFDKYADSRSFMVLCEMHLPCGWALGTTIQRTNKAKLDFIGKFITLMAFICESFEWLYIARRCKYVVFLSVFVCVQSKMVLALKF